MSIVKQISVVLVIPVAIIFIGSLFRIRDSDERDAARAKSILVANEILADGYVIERSYAPRRAICFEFDFEHGEPYIMELDSQRVLWCPYIMTDALTADTDDEYEWPNTYFRISQSRVHGEILKVECLGEALEIEREVELDEYNVEKYGRYIEEHNLNCGEPVEMRGSIDNLLAQFLLPEGTRGKRV